MKNAIATIAIVLLVLCVIVGIAVGGWYLERKIHYSLSYESMVKETIREMVKSEALKDSTK